MVNWFSTKLSRKFNKNSFLTNGTKKIGYSNASPHKIDPCLTFTKTSSKMDQNLNIKAKTTQMLEENIKEKF